MRLLKRLIKLIGDEGGNTLAIGAAAMPLVIGGAGLAIDTVQISLAKRELQRSADSAAMAGAYAINQFPASTGTTRTTYAQQGATRDLTINNDFTLSGTPVVQNAPAVGPFAGNANAVRVQLTGHRSLSFFSFFNVAPATITVEATAAIVREGTFCMLALEDGNVPGITVTGSAEINLGCGMSTNSSSATAISAGGASVVRASPIMAVGGIPESTNFGGSTLIPYSPTQQDPYASLPDPAPTGCRPKFKALPSDPTQVIGPTGSQTSICFSGMDINGHVRLRPGVYFIDGDNLSIGANAHITGTGVTFVLTSRNATSDPSSIAGMNVNGTPMIDLVAPTSGPYDGVLFYQDRRAPLGRNVTWSGNSSVNTDGAFYFPRSNFTFTGNAGMRAQCLQVVARTLEFTGNGTLSNNCSGTTSGENFQGSYVRLVA